MSWIDRLLSWFRPAIRYPSQAGPVAPFDEAELVRMHNLERLRLGGPPLRSDALLSAIANRRSATAAAAGLTAAHLHDGFAQVDVPGASKTGENAAVGQADAAAAMDSWMTSAGHRANVLDPGFQAMGAGRSISRDGVTYWFCIFAG